MPGSLGANVFFPRWSVLICLYEDRPAHLVGLELALLSLDRHCPEQEVLVSCSDASTAGRVQRLGLPRVRVVLEQLGSSGWDVKPALLLRRLAEGHDDVSWLDADVLVTGPLPALLTGASPRTIVVTEEPYWGDRRGRLERTVAWGLEPGRELRATVNSSVVRVTSQHRPLLQAWQALLATPEYREAQRLPFEQRPFHLAGDQDSLAALLASREFQDVPVAMLRRGIDIAQCHGPSGFTASERLRLRRSTGALPPLVHAQGSKPWAPVPPVPGASAIDRFGLALDRLHLQLSPYTAAAAAYEPRLGERKSWLHERGVAARLLIRAAAGDALVQELPLALTHSAAKRARRAAARVRSATPWRRT